MSDREQAAFGDWLAALDDLLCASYPKTCLLCGHQATWAEIRMVRHCPSLAIALCARCATQDPTRTRLDAILVQRYGPGV